MAQVQFGQADLDTRNPSANNNAPPRPQPFQPINTILNASLPCTPQGSLWDVSILHGNVHSTSTHDPAKTHSHIEHSRNTLNAHGALHAPALCHPHIHLDKPYLLSHPKYSHLQIEKGDFKEAMELTNKAKNNFEHDDLVERGQRVIDESVSAGVTSMRAFVEVDPIVGMKCLDAGIELKEEAKDTCHVQLCAFAQLALFSNHPDGGEEMRNLFQSAAERPKVEAIGSTPYVESSRELMERNVDWTIDLAMTTNKHLDFHLDYNLDAATEPLIWYVISRLKEKQWTLRTNKTIIFGHCTRLCLFRPATWKELKRAIQDLPISFVGLPTSDLFMMRSETQTRGTLPIPHLIAQHNLNACIGINNIGNAFTPQGTCDPLSIASMGVGVYQSGTATDADILYECVSTRARAAIGLAEETPGLASSPSSSAPSDGSITTTLEITNGKPADLLLFPSEKIDWRTRKSVCDVIYLYDGGKVRSVIKNGMLISSPR
ncbi:hypothetical protein BDV97DRAFT_295553 [Delphinella strobiligena]|nr:hypothetical protein BDV97DRAFT_295553 [Delphinella strobiligena]